MKNTEPIEIKTISDIYDTLTDENYDRFMTDFYIFFKQIGKLKKEHKEIKINSMLWTDDGIHKITGVTLNDDFIDFTSNHEEKDNIK